MKTRFLAVSLFSLFPLLAQGASFDCSKAASVTEKLICNNETVSKLDEQMASSYKQALANTPDPDSIKKAQVEWLKQQRACKDADCLTQSYKDRIEALNKVSPQSVLAAASVSTSSSSPSKPKYTITKGKQFELCRVFNDYLNSQYFKPSDCHVGVYPPDPRLRSPEYKQVDPDKYKEEIIKYRVKRRSDIPEMAAYIKKDFDMQLLHYWEVSMDLNGDGKADTLLVERNIFKKNFDESGCSTVSSLEENIFLISGGKISDEWGEGSILGTPFLFDGKPYLFGRGAAYDIAEPNKGKAVEKSFPTTGVCEFSSN